MQESEKKLYDDLEVQIKNLAKLFDWSEDDVREELLKLIESKVEENKN